MAASSSFSTAFALHTYVHGGGGGFASTSSSAPVRFLSGAVFGRVSRRSLILRSRGVSLVSPRCEAASDGAVPLNSIRPSSASALELLKNSAANRYTKERSSIIVIGLSVHSTPVEIREKLAIPEAEWPRAIGELCKLNHIEEAAVLSTCNRLEIYVLALSQHRAVKEVTEWMSKTSGVPVSEICKHRFLFHNRDATEHLYEVSSGLDSLVLGEGQILSQVKHVVTVGQSLKEFGRTIGGMFKEAIRVGKRVRTETNISSGAVSVSSAAVELALKKFPQSPHTTTRTLVVGAGKMGKLVIKHLAAKGFKKITVVNRSEERVKALRNEIKDTEIVYKPFSELYECSVKSDVIFTCTASESPLFVKEHVQNNKRVLFVDISVPRNVGSCVATIDTAKVYNVDDLKEVVDANKEDRLKKATEAKTIIDVEVRKFEAWRDSQETVPTIRGLNAVAERIRLAEFEKCLSKFGDDLTKKEKRAIEDLSNSIVRGLLSGPLQHLRCDGSGKRSMAETIDNMNALNRMYNLEDEIAAVLKEKIRAKMDQRQK